MTTEPYIKPFMKLWFWLLIFSIIGFIVYVVSFEQQQAAYDKSTIPSWSWVILILSIFFLIISFILYRLDVSAYYKKRDIAIACGEIPAEPPKPVLKCPKKDHLQKIICKQTKPIPCANSTTEQHIFYKTNQHPHIPHHHTSPNVQLVNQQPSQTPNVQLLNQQPHHNHSPHLPHLTHHSPNVQLLNQQPSQIPSQTPNVQLLNQLPSQIPSQIPNVQLLNQQPSQTPNVQLLNQQPSQTTEQSIPSM